MMLMSTFLLSYFLVFYGKTYSKYKNFFVTLWAESPFHI